MTKIEKLTRERNEARRRAKIAEAALVATVDTAYALLEAIDHAPLAWAESRDAFRRALGVHSDLIGALPRTRARRRKT